MFDLEPIMAQLGIKNFDSAQIVKLVNEHRKNIKLAFVVVTLILAAVAFNNFRIKEQALRAKFSQEQGKVGAIKSRDAAIEKLNKFKSTLTRQITELELVTEISNYANRNHITVASLNPADSRDMGLYDIIDVSFTAMSDNFKEAMLFLRNIEKSKHALRVNSWYGSEGSDGKISSEIAMSAVHIHP